MTISCTFSKILDASAVHQFSDFQFGFVPGRGTNMATALANDVILYCTKRGSTVYACSLDAEGVLYIIFFIRQWMSSLIIVGYFWLIGINR